MVENLCAITITVKKSFWIKLSMNCWTKESLSASWADVASYSKMTFCFLKRALKEAFSVLTTSELHTSDYGIVAIVEKVDVMDEFVNVGFLQALSTNSLSCSSSM